MEGFAIKVGEAAEVEAIAQFQVDMAAESEGTVLHKATVLEGVRAVVEDEKKGKYFVAMADGACIGSLMLTMEWSDWNNGWYWWIQSVYVRPEYRRRGVFSALYQAVRQAARQAGVSQLRLYVDKTNERAQNTYQKLGMHESHYLMYEEEIK
ncbi:MAG: GNAT family N-acetyltransferase [Bacteroidales bacterium]|nr:GNAT family N-acetyltransferase [Bacteroidales bacterium]